MGGLLDNYTTGSAYDEMFDADGSPHPHAKALYDALQVLDSSDLDERGAVRDRSFRDQGVTFSKGGEEWVFPLDLIPRLIPATEWETIEAGVIQRVRVLEAFLADLYGPQHVLDDRVVPRSLIATCPGFFRQAYGIDPQNGVRVHLSGIDLVRDEAGVLRVLEDNVRVPSGMSYVVENRRTMARVFPGLFLEQSVQPVAGHVTVFLEALRASAPAGVDDPTVVLLTPGVHNSAYFEHAFLARKMGIQLVEGRDLHCRDNTLYMRTTRGERRVDVVYRRVDDDWLDPVHFRPESVLGSPGMLNSARAGNVTIVNAVGNGVADDKLTYTYMPALIEYYLNEKPILPNVETYRLEDADVRIECLARLGELVLKPVDGSGGSGIVIGPHASEEQLDAARLEVEGNPRGWVAQELVTLSTCPAQAGHTLAPRHVDLRPFAVNDGSKIHVLPGGLTRVAMVEGSLVVNSSQGGGSKDTWVLASRPLRTSAAAGDLQPTPVRPSPAPDIGPADEVDLNSQQEQQQQQERQQQPQPQLQHSDGLGSADAGLQADTSASC